MDLFQPLDNLNLNFCRALEFVFVAVAILVLWENMLAEDQLQKEAYSKWI